MERSYVLALKDHPFSELYLCYAGISQCAPNHAYGPAVRPMYLIHYILSGRGIFQAKGQTWQLKAGQGFVIEPDLMTRYQADETDPWSYCWVGFSGTRAKESLKDLGLGDDVLVFSCTENEAIKQVVSDMLAQSGQDLKSQYQLQGDLYQFFSLLIKNAPAGIKAEPRDTAWLLKAKQYIQNHYAEPMQVADVADHLGLTRSYLYKLFMDGMGISVKDYISALRITNARELLTVTDMSIEEVARACGYEDYRGFGKIFKKETGMSMSEFRKQNKENIKISHLEFQNRKNSDQETKQ